MVTEAERTDILTSLDVAAHEMGHAVCEKQQIWPIKIRP
jgi:Zn-dependent membrane protease YugP